MDCFVSHGTFEIPQDKSAVGAGTYLPLAVWVPLGAVANPKDEFAVVDGRLPLNLDVRQLLIQNDQLRHRVRLHCNTNNVFFFFQMFSPHMSIKNVLVSTQGVSHANKQAQKALGTLLSSLHPFCLRFAQRFGQNT